MKKISILILAISVIACKNNDENKEQQAPPKVEFGKSANSDVFNVSFEQLLNNYYALKEAFVKEDTTSIAKNGNSLITSCDSLKLQELKIDKDILATAKQNVENIAAEVKGILGEKNLDEQRKDFHLISNDIYSLIRTVRYDKQIIFFQHCPMAFDNKGADWLSASNEIVNPYMPKQMIDCGSNKDSVDFRPRK
ncbi:MAG: DUF3347 domain-containing protein [Chitinophagaceae bacterium]